MEFTVSSCLQGTQLYDPKAGGWRDLGMLDVMQVGWDFLCKVHLMLVLFYFGFIDG